MQAHKRAAKARKIEYGKELGRKEIRPLMKPTPRANRCNVDSVKGGFYAATVTALGAAFSAYLRPAAE